MSRRKTKTYRLIRGTHNRGKQVIKEGDLLELSPRQARALVNKVELVTDQQASDELFPQQAAQQPLQAPTTVEELHLALTGLGVEFSNTETEEELRDKYAFATLPG